MDISAFFVDWQHATERAALGQIQDDLVGLTEGVPWLEEAEFDDSFEQFSTIGRAYESLRPFVGAKTASLLATSFDRFLREEPQPWIELPGELDPENYFLALSTETSIEIGAKLDELQLGEFETLYVDHVPDDVKDELGESPEEFIAALDRWIALITEAAERGKGLIVKVG